MPQQLNQFREGRPDIELCLREQEDGSFIFEEKDSHTGNWIKREDYYHITQEKDEKNERFWLRRDYKQAWNAYKDSREEWGNLNKVGLLHLPDYGRGNNEKEWRYSDQFGMYDEKEDFDQ